jgi:hypothetical protein
MTDPRASDWRRGEVQDWGAAAGVIEFAYMVAAQSGSAAQRPDAKAIPPPALKLLQLEIPRQTEWKAVGSSLTLRFII